jgi:hypothetical protein
MIFHPVEVIRQVIDDTVSRFAEFARVHAHGSLI